MWWDLRFRREMARAGLTGFRAVMTCRAGRCLRVLADRENWRLELHPGRKPACGAYLKKHRVRTWFSRLRAKLGVGPGETAGRVEARNIRRLTADGIACMGLVAYGEDLDSAGRLDSFVLTEELEGFLPLDDFVERRFPTVPAGRAGPRNRHLQELIRQVAAVVREFHGAGYNHRDLYCCHLFVREPVPGRFEVRLIDLQRVQHRRRRRRRWLVKDLAQLAYSAPRDRLRCTHRIAFMRWYLGVRSLRACDKRLVRAVLAKQRRMERKEGRVA